MLVFAVVVVVGIMKKGLFGFLGMFAPPGVPLILLPFIYVIELISFLLRPFTLGVRLFANMLAGHMMLKVFAGFVVSLLAAGGAVGVLSILPMLGVVGVTALEFLVAFLQAYVFAVLTCIYLNDVVHDHHH
jgi:F-type H+-transporting ATPase subunit a